MRAPCGEPFDVHTLQPGDVVEVFVDEEGGWRRGRFDITTRGDAVIELVDRRWIDLAEALRSGIRMAR